jgi:hypothetical protein
MRSPVRARKTLWTLGLFGKFRVPLVALPLVVAAAALTVFLVARPRAVWLVDEAYVEQWERILGSAEPPRRLRVVAAPAEGGRPLPGNRYGFIISDRGPLERAVAAAETEAEEEEPLQRSLVVYPRLSATREYEGALVLALDPWMVFKDFNDPAVSRDRVDAAGGGEGVLIMPGRDTDSRWAWAAQLVQRQSGIFPEDKAAWRAATEGLFWDNRRFQPGAETYGWLDAMPLFYRSSPAWIYAPLSRMRRQPSQETSNLEANRYPEPEDWHEFGIQAALLWALPFGREKRLAKLGDLQTWLADAKTQTAIANTLGWIPALPEGASYNSVSRSARLAYLSSSFIWTFH